MAYGDLDFSVPAVAVDAPPPAVDPDTAWPDTPVADLAGLLADVVSDTEVADQSFADSQYDSTVQGHTWHGPRHGPGRGVRTGYWAGTPVPGSPAAAVLTTAFNPWLAEAHPVRALRQIFLSVLSGQVLSGVEVRDICLCDNFYTPNRGQNAYPWLVAMVDELAMLIRHFGVPVISGKDSSAGSTTTDEGVVDVPPGVFLTALGKVPHVDQLLPERWTAAGNVLIRIGPPTSALTGTAAARTLGLDAAGVDEVDLDAMGRYLAAVRASRGMFRSGTRIDSGGTGAQMVQGVLASGFGVDLDPAVATAEDLFAEHRCGALVEVRPEDLSSLPPELRPVRIGVLSDVRGIRVDAVDLLTAAVHRGHAESFKARLM